MKILPVLLALALVSGACRSEPPPDTLESLSLRVPPREDAVIVSLNVAPERGLRVNAVKPRAGEGMKARYLGYVTDCDDVCGVHPATRGARQRVSEAVEGRVPIDIPSEGAGVYLLLLLELTETGSEILEEGDCVVLRSVDLDVEGEDEDIRVFRQALQFLWVLSRTDESCLEKARLVR